jgi:hypothetical protein
VKLSKTCFHAPVHTIPDLHFEDNRLTSFAGSVILQKLFHTIRLPERLRECFSHRTERLQVGFSCIALLLITHLMLGYRKLREVERYQDDPVVKRTLGFKRIPHVSTISRTLSRMDRGSVENVRALSREIVLERLAKERMPRVTMDFDGSVLSTTRYAEGTAVGYNTHKKGDRSYYPLFCTIAQTSQVLDVLHRRGNVHDSHGSLPFITACIQVVRTQLPGVILESRHDSAFFSDKTVELLAAQNVLFSISVPFERFSELKSLIESCHHWKHLDREWDYYESTWTPKCWKSRCRMLMLRHRVKKQNKDPIQFELFVPHEEGYEFKVIATNKMGKAKTILLYHNGRGAQENIFSELKSQCNMSYVPTRRQSGNQLYYQAAVLGHNLYRELQMVNRGRDRITSIQRAPLWKFEESATLRHKIIQRAGRLTRPHGHLRLTLSGNEATRRDIRQYLDSLASAG